MSGTTLDTSSQLPARIVPTSPPKTKKPRRELTNTERVDIRQFYYDDSRVRPSQKEVIQWFEREHYYTLTQSQILKILSCQYSFLDDKNLTDKARNKSAEYPDLKDMLH